MPKEKRKMVYFEFSTGNLKYSKFRKRLIKFADKLDKIEYFYLWRARYSDLDFGNLDFDDMIRTGWTGLYIKERPSMILRYLHGKIYFNGQVFIKSKRIKIHGSNHVSAEKFKDVKKGFDKFEKISGIRLRFEHVNEYEV